ncbi:hypothetical protein [Microbacterium sp. 22242]|uniref:hypothetical protein n=1 Tax=Microbacterium sp. 22242 TaxID=3453896 RepID=UPI003F8486E0
MCSRFAVDDKINESFTEFVERTGRRLAERSPDWGAANNIKPTEQIPILLEYAKTGELRFDSAGWALVPRDQQG